MNTVLHSHWESRFDAVPKTIDMIMRLKEIGAKAVAITDHGSVAAIEDAYDEIEHLVEKKELEEPIKIIYGEEAYLEMPAASADEKEIPAHLILMAKDPIGKHAIDKLVYAANANPDNRRNYLIITKEMLENILGVNGFGHGHVIITTACVSGPIGRTLQANDFMTKKIEKIEAKIKKGLEERTLVLPDDAELAKKEAKVLNLQEQNKAMSAEKAELQKVAKKPTTMLEKKAAKLRDIGKEMNALIVDDQIQEIKTAAEKACERISDLTMQIEANKRMLKEENDALKKLRAAASKYDELIADAQKKEKMLVPESVLVVKAKEQMAWLLSVAGEGNLYAEIQYHGMLLEEKIYKQTIKIAKAMNIPLVAANDAHMANNSEHDLNARKVAKFLHMAKIDTEEQDDVQKEMYLKSHDELASALLQIFAPEDVKEALDNADKIGDLCEGYARDTNSHYPVYKKGVDAKTEIIRLAHEGIEWRYPGKTGWTDEHQKRLEYELKIINQMGFADYHLIVKEMLEYARELGKVPNAKIKDAPLNFEKLKNWIKENGWDIGVGIGPARGSAAGSIVCYLLGITNIDPIKYGLLFERFLNPERVSMPDIDADYKTNIRSKTIEYIKSLCGEKAVCNIMTKGYQQVKGAIRDATRYYGALNEQDFYSLGEKIRKVVPNGVGVSFDTKMSDLKKGAEDITLFEYLKNQFAGNADAIQILNIAKDVEGSFTNYGMHAAGLIISDNDNLSDYIPLRLNHDKDEGDKWTTQCNMVQSEKIGLLKMDLLNLKTLDIITDALRMIKKNHGVSIDVYKIPFEAEVFREIYAKANTIGVFQFESPGMRTFLKRLKPKDINDVIILNAMFRPGPMDFIPGVCDVKNGRCKPHYETPELEPILKDTYGAIVYQEQVMQIFQVLAGYSMGQADNIRRAMSKKKQYVIDEERKSFIFGDPERNISGCFANGIKESAANKVYDSMVDFAKYAFNKSHAAAYSVLSYQTAWLKYHYPAEYICSLLIHTDKLKDYPKFIQNAREMGVEVLPPDINRSEAQFSVQNGKIYFGLNSIKSVGEVVKEVVEMRKKEPFTSFNDFAIRSDINSRSQINLILAGAFDSLGYSRTSLLGAAYKDIADLAKEMKDKQREAGKMEKVANLLKKETFATVEELNKRISEENIAYSIKTKKVPTADNLQAKVEKAKKAAKEAEKAIKEIQIPYIKSNVEDDLENEREVLGMYLSGHPIDQYEVTTTPITDLQVGRRTITGIIENIEMYRNKQGNPWAKITVSDRSGSIGVTLFARQFAACESFIQSGKGIVIDGSVEVDEYRSNMNSDDSEDIVYCVNAEKVRPAIKQRKTYLIDMKSEADFFFSDYRETLRKYETEDETGVCVMFYFEDSALFRKLNYHIPESIAEHLGKRMDQSA